MKTYLDYTVETAGMNKFGIEVWLNRHFGHTIGFIANLITTRGYKAAKAKLEMLAALAAEGRVTTASFTTDYVLVDGRSVALGSLENAVDWVKDAEGNKTLQPDNEIFF